MEPDIHPHENPDPAAAFACALSLWQACKTRAALDLSISLSDIFNGIDQLMREVARIGQQFEIWACEHIDFNELDAVWPYLLESGFGDACVACTPLEEFSKFDDTDCLRVAIRLGLPVKLTLGSRVPVEVCSPLPPQTSSYSALRIHTVRNLVEDREVVQFTVTDDPFDDEFGEPYFALYGVDEGELLEHISDRRSYAEAVALATKLCPSVRFPVTPTVGKAQGRLRYLTDA